MKPEDDFPLRDQSDDQGALPSDAERVADERLLDALLTGRHEDTPESTAQRVERVCHALETAPRVISLRWKAGLSTAAAAVVVLGLLLTLSAPQSVQADLAPILTAFDKGDKTYQITIAADTNEPAPRRGFGRRRFGRRLAFKPPRRGMMTRRLDNATLQIRGRRYVLTCRTGRGGEVLKGFDGQESWLVCPWGASARGDDHSLLEQEIPDHISSLLFLDLRDMLHQIEAQYALSGPSAGTLDDGQTPTQYYRAERIGRRDRMPRRIEFWVDPLTHELQQIVCTGVHFRGPGRQRYTLRITLVSTEPLPEEWFTQQAHIRPSPNAP